MGRELRLVPPNWEHPKRICPHRPTCEGYKCFQPMYNTSYDEACEEWIEAFKLWQEGKHSSQLYEDPTDEKYYWDYEVKALQSLHHSKLEKDWLNIYALMETSGTSGVDAKVRLYIAGHGLVWWLRIS